MPTREIDRECPVTLTDQVGELLREDLANGTYRPGAKLPAEPALARLYSVSRVTIRRALALVQSEGLIVRRKGKGTFAAEADPANTPNGRAPTDQWLAVLIEMDISNPAVSYFWLRATQALRRCLAEKGYTSRLYVGHALPTHAPPPQITTCEEFLADLAAGHVRGLVTVGLPLTPEFDALLQRHGITWLDIGAVGKRPVVDYDAMIAKGVDSLWKAGRKRIACLSYAIGADRNRSTAFAWAMLERNLPVFPEWIVGAWPDSDVPDGVAAFHRLWEGRDEKPDGLLITDEALYREIEPVVLFNRVAVPQTLAIATHWNKGDPRRAHLPLIRIEVDPDEVAALAAGLLLDRLADPHAPADREPVEIRVVADDQDAWHCGLALGRRPTGAVRGKSRAVTAAS